MYFHLELFTDGTCNAWSGSNFSGHFAVRDGTLDRVCWTKQTEESMSINSHTILYVMCTSTWNSFQIAPLLFNPKHFRPFSKAPRGGTRITGSATDIHIHTCMAMQYMYRNVGGLFVWSKYSGLLSIKLSIKIGHRSVLNVYRYSNAENILNKKQNAASINSLIFCITQR